MIVWEALQAAEKMMKIAMERRKMSFRPKISLALAKTTMTADGEV